MPAKTPCDHCGEPFWLKDMYRGVDEYTFEMSGGEVDVNVCWPCQDAAVAEI